MALSKEQLKKIYDKVNNGDKEAIDFIVNYPEMSEEDANKYLTKLAIASPSEETQKGNSDDVQSMNEFLIKDENEAINGYDKGILLMQSIGCEKGKAVYESIKQDELRHISMLKQLNDELVMPNSVDFRQKEKEDKEIK